MNVYFIRAGNRGAIKIGIARDIDRRIATLQCGNAFELKVMALIPCDNRIEALELERRIHKIFERQRIRGEWFQGNINFKKVRGIIDIDTTKSSDTYEGSGYKPVRNAKKKRQKARIGNNIAMIG